MCFKWLYRLVSKKDSKQELPTYSSEWKARKLIAVYQLVNVARDTLQGNDKEWEDWETEALTVTVVPNNGNTSEPAADSRLKYSTRCSKPADNDPSAEELFHDMQPVFKKPKKVVILSSFGTYMLPTALYR